jgi:serine protease Do
MTPATPPETGATPSDASRGSRRLRLGLAAVVVIAGSVLLGMNLRTPEAHANSYPPAPAAAPAPPLPAIHEVDSYADLVSRVSPSVVTVRTERVVRSSGHEFVFPDDPFLRQFFGQNFHSVPPEAQREGALGSGVIVSPDGYILTNHHVVKGAQQIEVDLADRRTFKAKLVGSDAPSDLAVLKIDAKGLPALPFGDSNHTRVGDVVLAFGNPLGVGQTVTMGIISAKGRTTDLGDGSFEDFLQTDAPINQGNSGGALVNLRGQLVGINSQIITPSGGSVGIGFAIPSAMAENVMQQLIRSGHVERGRLGVVVQTVTSDLAKSLGMKKIEGALVSQVTPGSAAAKAGLERGDVIVRLNGTVVEDSNDLRNRVSSTPPGTEVNLTVLRGEHERILSAKLDELQPKTTAENVGGGENEGGRLGLSVRPLSPDEAHQLGLERDEGLVVAEVDPSGPAADSGFQPGDVIEQVNGQPISSASALREAVKASGDRPALVLVARKGDTFFLTLQGRG